MDEGMTYSMRGKEEAHDYRYFPEPDLVPLIVDEAWVEQVRKELPELPVKQDGTVYKRSTAFRGTTWKSSTGDRALADYFEETVRLFPEPKTVSNWIMSELLRELKTANISAADSPASACASRRAADAHKR